MFFTIRNKDYFSPEQLRIEILMKAYYIIENYRLNAQDLAMDLFIQQQYKTTLKDLCIKLLLSLTMHRNGSGDFILLFKDQEHDKLARLITYGNGVVLGSRILRTALSS